MSQNAPERYETPLGTEASDLAAYAAHHAETAARLLSMVRFSTYASDIDVQDARDHLRKAEHFRGLISEHLEQAAEADRMVF